MSANDCEAAARKLVEARSERRVLASADPAVAPATVGDAYAIQDAFRRLWPDRLIGWKAGATSVSVQQKLGAVEPFAGPFFAADTVASPAELPAARFAHLCLECEFAFRLGEPLPARSRGYARDEVIPAVSELVPAIEIISPRFDSLLAGRATTAIADCALDAGFVLGAPIADWRHLDLASHVVTLLVDGAVRAQGTGAAVLGHPLDALTWTVDHLSARGIDLAAGDVLSTGTTTGLVYVAPEQSAVADFGVLGHVAVRFTGPPHPSAVRAT